MQTHLSNEMMKAFALLQRVKLQYDYDQLPFE